MYHVQHKEWLHLLHRSMLQIWHLTLLCIFVKALHSTDPARPIHIQCQTRPQKHSIRSSHPAHSRKLRLTCGQYESFVLRLTMKVSKSHNLPGSDRPAVPYTRRHHQSCTDFCVRRSVHERVPSLKCMLARMLSYGVLRLFLHEKRRPATSHQVEVGRV